MEHRLVWSIDKLRMDADRAYESAKRLLASRRSFANAMSDMLDASTDSEDSSEMGEFVFRNNKRVMHSGDTIVMHSMALSEQVAMMQEELTALVDMIDQWKKKEKKKSSLFPTLWNWILKGFTSILSLVAAGTAFVPIVRPFGVTASTTLASGARLATALTDLVQRSQDGREESDFDRIMNFLQFRIPLEAKRAEACMSKFRECHALLQMDDALREGRPVVMKWEESRRARSKWRSHRKQFEHAKEDVQDEDENNYEASLIDL